MINVIDINGNSLPSIMREGKVRRLLKQHKAKVVNYNPFTIQLSYPIMERNFNMTNIKEFIDMNKYAVHTTDDSKNTLQSYSDSYFKLFKGFNEPGENEDNTPSEYYFTEHFFFDHLNNYMIVYEDGKVYSITPSRDKLDTLALLQTLADVMNNNAKLFVSLADIVEDRKDYPCDKSYIRDSKRTMYEVSGEFIDTLKQCLTFVLENERLWWFGRTPKSIQPSLNKLHKVFSYNRTMNGNDILDDFIKDITNYHNALTHVYGDVDTITISVSTETSSKLFYNLKALAD